MQPLGVKRTLLAGVVLTSASTALSLFMAEPWHYLLTWGVLSGFGSGAVALAMGATVVNRWFVTRRGENFGEREGPIVFGWIAFGHQVGAATAAFGAGMLRDIQGDYLGAFVIAGLLGIFAACAALMIRREGDGPAATPVPAG
jgi:MFS family permease